jgi:hypothetical protein
MFSRMKCPGGHGGHECHEKNFHYEYVGGIIEVGGIGIVKGALIDLRAFIGVLCIIRRVTSFRA